MEDLRKLTELMEKEGTNSKVVYLEGECYAIIRKSKSYDWGVPAYRLSELGFRILKVHSYNRKDEVIIEKIKQEKD